MVALAAPALAGAQSADARIRAQREELDRIRRERSDLEKRMMNLQGNVAVSVPNPNTKGQAYVDDMEGNRESNTLSLGRLGSFYEHMTPAQFWALHAAVAAAGGSLALLLNRPLMRMLEGPKDLA